MSRPPLANVNTDKVEFVRTLEKVTCHINFITIDGKDFLVKQKKKLVAYATLSTVCEALAAHIAESFSDLAHKVDIIPAGKKMLGKVYIECPATLHTIAPGRSAKESGTIYESMDLRQKDIGFNYALLKWMVRHPTLVTIVALDTFLCNGDRHRGNIFYNEADNTFYAIDMEASFKYNYCILACSNITHMMIDLTYVLSDDGLNVLDEYKKNLEFLIAHHTLEKTIEKYYDFLEQAGIVEGSCLFTKKVQMDILYSIAIIKESYEDAKKLVAILTMFLTTIKDRKLYEFM